MTTYLELVHGTTPEWSGQAVKPDGSPEDLTSATITMRAAPYYGEEPTFELTNGSGVEITDEVQGLYTVQPPASAVVALDPSREHRLVYVLVAERGAEVLPLDAGVVIVKPVPG